MKNCLVILSLIVFSLSFVASDLMAYNSNLSVEFLRNPSRYASQDVDAAIYNPAGLARLAKDGLLYVAASNQFYMKEYTFEYAGFENTADDPIYLFPNASVVYKQSNWAMFATLTIPDGGGTLTYEDVKVALPAALGGGTLILPELKGESYWIAYTLGGSFALNDMVAFSSGIRWYTTTQSTDVKVPAIAGLGLAANTYSKEVKADGMAAFIGFNVTPMPGLNIGIQYQSKVRARGTADVTSDIDYANLPSPPYPAAAAPTFRALGIEEVGKTDYFEELPAYLQIGVGYAVMPELNVSFSGQYVFQKEVKVSGEAVEFENQNNSWGIALGADYAVMPGLKVSLGFIYSVSADTEESNTGVINSTNPGLDSYSIGLGASYVAIEGLTIDIGFIKPIFKEGETADVPAQKLNKTLWGAALGVTYRAL